VKKSLKIASPNAEFTVTLSVGNAENYFSLPLISIPFSYEEYQFRADKFITGLQVENYIRPRLKIRWPELTISHRFAPLIYQLPKTVVLTYLQAYKLRQILRKPHFALMHLRYGLKSRILPLRESDWMMQTAETNISLTPVRQQAEAPAHIRDSPPVYPHLHEASFV
jgi:hypothetical protein